MDRFSHARDRGGQFLRQNLGADGSFGDPVAGVADYYKVPAALQVCGDTEAANRLCRWIRRHGMLESGDFGPRPDFGHDYFYSYFNIWVVIGAARLGQFDLAHRGMDFLMDFHDPESGGFYSSPSARDAATRQDLWVVSGCGQAALYTGLHLEPPPPESPEASSDDDVRYCLVNATEGDQYFFHPGIAGGFLGKLHLATGENEWLELAIDYMRFAEDATPHLLRLLRAGKVAWAASVLYTTTGESRYRELAITVGDNIIERQSGDGYWDWEGEPSNDITAEMVYWLDEVYQAVGS